MMTTNSPVLPDRFADLAASFDSLAHDAVKGIAIVGDRTDPTFGEFGLIAGFVRSAANIEGAVLEAGLRSILTQEGGFNVLPSDFKLPVIEAATAAVRSNEKDALVALRLDPKVFAPEHYTPDLVAVHRESGVGYLLELKRTTGSYASAVLERLEEKMTAAGLVARDALLSGRRRLMVSRVEVAIVDCSDADRRDQVIDLDGLDDLLACPGVGDSLRYLRSRYAHHIQSALGRMVDTGGERTTIQPAITPELVAEPLGHPEDENLGTDDVPVAINFARKRRLAKAQGQM